MSLKTTYKDDKFSGRRKYQMIENDDGTISLDDVTDYVEEGDVFSSHDINTTNKAVNDADEKIETNAKETERQIAGLKAQRIIKVPAQNWSQSIPYSQKIAVAGITSKDSPAIGGPWMGDLPSAEIAKNRKKAFGYVDRAESGEGTITLYCYGSRPAVDFAIMIKGV